MDVFLNLVSRLSPLYGYIILGFVAGKYLGVTKQSVGSILINIILPVVFFYAIATTVFTPATYLIPVIVYILCVVVALMFLGIGKLILKDKLAHMLSMGAGLASYSYYGVPVAALLFPADIVQLVVIAGVGYMFFENTIGYYIAANGQFSARESLIRLFRLPALYAIFLGLTVNLLKLPLPPQFPEIAAQFKGALAVLGLMVTGLGISDVPFSRHMLSLRDHAQSIKYVLLVLMSKFIVWPLLMTGAILFDRTFLHLYTASQHQMFLFLSLLPMASNTIIYAMRFHNGPKRTAIAVVSTIVIAMIAAILLALSFA